MSRTQQLVSRASVVAIVAFAATAMACSGSSDTSVGTDPAASGAGDAGANGGGKDGGGSSTPPTTSDAGVNSNDAAVSGDAPAANCVAPSYAGNEKKIGAYCDAKVSCPFQIDPFLICTADHDPTKSHSFCTTPCSKDSECGSGAYCMHDPAGSGCVPAQCGGAPGK